jgi:hypothetical protein
MTDKLKTESGRSLQQAHPANPHVQRTETNRYEITIPSSNRQGCMG